MSNQNIARRAAAEVAFDGVDITDSIAPYLLSLTYTDFEEDAADDLQIKLHDREDVWLTSWLGQALEAAVSRQPVQTDTAEASEEIYSVNAKPGIYVRSGTGTSFSKLGSLVYGAAVKVSKITNNWAEIMINGKKGFISADYIDKVKADSDGVNIGDSVIVNGTPYYTSYGGWHGNAVSNYEGVVTSLNPVKGAPYPIRVNHLGWFATDQVRKNNGATSDSGSLPGSAEDSTVTASTGLKIQAVISSLNWDGDGKDKTLECGQFELDDIDVSGPPSTITIKATALPFTSQIRQTKKSRAWESYYLSGIAKEMARKNGMACMYLSDKDPFYNRVEQFETSDMSFLSKLCHQSGISLKVSNNIIVLFDQATYEAKDTVLTIKKGDKSYLKYHLHIAEAEVHYSSCRVSCTTSDGKLIEAIAKVKDYDEEATTNQQLEIRAQVSSVADAKVLAVKSLRLHNKFQRTAQFTMPGNPDLVSGITVMLDGWGTWDGKYIISQSQHTIGSGYTVQIHLRKVLEGY